MKKLCALIVMLAIFLSACSAPVDSDDEKETKKKDKETADRNEQEEETEEEPEEEPEEETEAEEKDQDPEEPICYPLEAQDQYTEHYRTPYGGYSYCVHIPTLYWNGQECQMLREQIYFDHMSQIEATALEGQPMYSAAYSLGQTERVASVITCFSSQDYDHTKYSIFHVDLATGQETTDGRVLESFGYTWDQFYEEVRTIAQERFESTFADMQGFGASESYYEMLGRQVSDETIREARPYVDENGQLCALVTLIVPAGAGAYLNRVGLQTQDHTVAPEQLRCTLEH